MPCPLSPTQCWGPQRGRRIAGLSTGVAPAPTHPRPPFISRSQNALAPGSQGNPGAGGTLWRIASTFQLRTPKLPPSCTQAWPGRKPRSCPHGRAPKPLLNPPRAAVSDKPPARSLPLPGPWGSADADSQGQHTAEAVLRGSRKWPARSREFKCSTNCPFICGVREGAHLKWGSLTTQP